MDSDDPTLVFVLESLICQPADTKQSKKFSPLAGEPTLIHCKKFETLHLAINTELRLLICNICCSALLPKSVFNHLRTTHKTLLRGLTQAQFLQVCKDQRCLEEWPHIRALTVGPRKPFAGLAVMTERSVCTECGHLGTPKDVKQHVKIHGARSQPPILDNCLTQVLNRGGTGYAKKTFWVERIPEQAAQQGSQLLPNFKRFSSQAAGMETEIPNARLISPLLLRTRWHEYIQPHQDSIGLLIELASMPEKDDFPALHSAVLDYFQHATEFLPVTEEPVLQRINSSDPAKDGINNTPLHDFHQPERTLTAYIVPVTRLLAALLRQSSTVQLPSSEALRGAVTMLKERMLETGLMTTGLSPPAIQLLHNVFKALWLEKWKADEGGDSHWADPTMCFLALFCLEPSGTFFQPPRVTTPVSKLCRAIRLVVLMEIHTSIHMDKKTTQEKEMERCAPFVMEHTGTTFGSLMSLQHYATALTLNSMALPHIVWIDLVHGHRLMFKGQSISLKQLQSVFDTLEAQIVKRWEAEVLLGLPLMMEYGTLSDDLLETKQGYSFFKDKANGLSNSGSKLLEAILGNDKIRKDFTIGNGSSFNYVRCRQWLQALASVECMLLVYIDLTSGATTRGTELVSMLACNSLYRVRNVMSVGRYVALIRQYDKTTNLRQEDKLIPHALSSFCGDLLIQVHTLARPLASFLASELWPTPSSDCALKYRQMLFMDYGREFTSDKLSAAMGEFTSAHLDWSMQLAAWRHVNIAMRRKLCNRSLDSVDQDPFSAMQSGHTRGTEDRIYGLSANALLGAPEDLVQTFLSISTDWQLATKVVPGGLNLRYNKSLRGHFNSLVEDGTIKTNPVEQTSSQMETMLEMQKAMLKEIKSLRRELRLMKARSSKPILTISYCLKKRR
ncbi:unnamed protein product [Mycena citricolor]|uniref:C2H2-type domain-containing protein n=1 Tax=Mycena citricolor TaxID=2018698 RepID=A0AAD2Q0Z7_9AGAR|nr:unnamed protein product [Mycena citricolor]